MNKSKGKSFDLWVVILSFAFLLLPSLAMACPLCKEALFDPGQAQQKFAAAKGYALSIGLLLAMPLGLILGIAALIVHAQRRASRERTSSSPSARP